MSEVTNESLKKIGTGTTMVLVGTGVGLLLALVTRIIIARYGTANEYGAFSLALVIISIAVMIASLGLQDGTARYIAYFRGKGEADSVQQTISASMRFATFASIILCPLILFGSDLIAVNIFHDVSLSLPLKIFALGIPFLTITNIFVSIFRGYGKFKEKICIQDILGNALFLLLLFPIFFLHLSFTWVFYAYLISIVICALVLGVYTTKKLAVKIITKSRPYHSGIKLLSFSIPLLIVSMFQLVLSYTDILMLGYFKTSDFVGLYNAALPLATVIGIPMGALLFIYAPIITGLYAQDLIDEIRRTYAIVTKWVFSTTFPLFLIIALFPENFINLFFGANYIAASHTLRLLSLGFLIVNLLGPNGTTLMVVGKTRFLMWVSAAAAGINMILNIAMIPHWGVEGAAISTLISTAVHCIVRHIKVHQLLKINPLSKNLLKPVLISTGLIIPISLLLGNFVSVTSWMIPLLLVLFYFIFFMSMLLSKSFDQEDILMMATIENKLGVNFSPIKKMMKKFL